MRGNVRNQSRSCVSCDVFSRKTAPPGGVLLETDRWLLNHRLPDGAQTWTGWFVLQPIKHICRFNELDPLELRELGSILRQLDKDFRLNLDSDRMYLANLGATAEDHLHLHIVPVKGPQLPGISAFGPARESSGTVDELLEKLPLEDWGVFKALTRTEEHGIAKGIENLAKWVRAHSLFNVTKHWQSRQEGRASSIVEMYVLFWVALLSAALSATWIFGGVPAVSYIALGLAIARLIEIIAVQTHLTLFELQSANGVGTQSVARSVILGLVNVFEVLLCLAISASVLELRHAGADFDHPMGSALDALLWTTGPLGGGSINPVSVPATAMTLTSIGIVAFLVVIVIGFFVGNLSAGLHGYPDTPEKKPAADREP